MWHAEDSSPVLLSKRNPLKHNNSLAQAWCRGRGRGRLPKTHLLTPLCWCTTTLPRNVTLGVGTMLWGGQTWARLFGTSWFARMLDDALLVLVSGPCCLPKLTSNRGGFLRERFRTPDTSTFCKCAQKCDDNNDVCLEWGRMPGSYPNTTVAEHPSNPNHQHSLKLGSILRYKQEAYPRSTESSSHSSGLSGTESTAIKFGGVLQYNWRCVAILLKEVLMVGASDILLNCCTSFCEVKHLACSTLGKSSPHRPACCE